MHARERILTIRLMEKVEKHPAYAKILGIEIAGARNDQNEENDPKDLCSGTGRPCALTGER